MVTLRNSMSNHYCWDCHRQFLSELTPQSASGPSRVEYVQQVNGGYGVPVANSETESYAWVAGPKYGNHWGNEGCCMEECCWRGCRSFYGGNSSTLPEVVHFSTDGSLLRGSDLHAITSTTNRDYWRDYHNGQTYPTSAAQYATTSGVQYGQESYCRQGPTVDLENDAATGSLALQKELPQAADAESYKGTAGWGNEAFCRTSSCRYDCGSSYGSDSSMFMEITDKPRIDGEVRKRIIDQMDCIPHVPKINSRIPSADEATSDHERLLNRLELYDLHELKVSGDGNCQFRALSDQLYRTSEYHKEMRQQVVDQLKANPDLYAPYVPMPYHEYLTKISMLGEWGDHVTLQAAADWYGVRIFVLTSYRDTCYIEILPRQQKSEKVIILSFWAEVHYNSIYPREESHCCMSESDRRRNGGT